MVREVTRPPEGGRERLGRSERAFGGDLALGSLFRFDNHALEVSTAFRAQSRPSTCYKPSGWAKSGHDLVRVDGTGTAHPVGKTASQRMRARQGAFRLMPSPAHLVVMRYVGEEGAAIAADGASSGSAARSRPRARSATSFR